MNRRSLQVGKLLTGLLLLAAGIVLFANVHEIVRSAIGGVRMTLGGLLGVERLRYLILGLQITGVLLTLAGAVLLIFGIFGRKPEVPVVQATE